MMIDGLPFLFVQKDFKYIFPNVNRELFYPKLLLEGKETCHSQANKIEKELEVNLGNIVATEVGNNETGKDTCSRNMY